MTKDQDPLGIIGITVENKYRILELAGEGGFSAVYKAEHLIWNEPVAVKFFNILNGATEDMRETLLADFIQEGKLMSRLSSRSASIVQARDIGKLELDDEWIPYMVLEWLEGVPLDVAVREDRARGAARTLPEAMNLLDPVAGALDVAHQEGVAHRDLKPANVVIMGDPWQPGVSVKVLDFGIAKVMADHAQLQEQLQLTGQQITAFTPNYGAPEQFSRNFGATGPWTDVFAMALILVELMRGGDKALQGDTFFELGVKACDGDSRPTPQTLGLDVPADVEAVFAKALALHPKDRFSRMSEFWAALHHIVFPSAQTWQPRGRPTSMNTGPNPAVTSLLDSGNPLSISGGQALSGGHRPTDDLTSADTQAVTEGAGLPNGSTQAALAGPVLGGQRSNAGLIIGTVVVVAALAGGAIFALTSSDPVAETASEAGTAAAADPPPAPQDAETGETTEPETATAAEPTPSAASVESAAPSATASPPRPRVARPRPPPPKKDPKPKAGADAWDPSSFGGR